METNESGRFLPLFTFQGLHEFTFRGFSGRLKTEEMLLIFIHEAEDIPAAVVAETKYR